MKGLYITVFLFCFQFAVTGLYATRVDKVEPRCWWTGMHTNTVQLLIYGQDLKGSSVSLPAGQTKIVRVEDADSPNYLFVTLEIGKKQQAGELMLTLKKDGKEQTIAYPLFERQAGKQLHNGFDRSDVIYLLMPDRFANGDPSNDTSPLTKEKADRNNPNGRHGGDIAGMIRRLGYLEKLGVTAIWPTPLWCSDHEKNTYHGYACTDFYAIDPRYGTNELYREFVEQSHIHNLKVIMDMVPNHCSISHPWVADPPMEDWIHPLPADYTRSLAISAWNDPYISEIDYQLNKDGWFSALMPDLNQNNEKLLCYLVQNAIWWIEYAGLDGVRVDTYPYCERDKIARWTKAITDEYPAINIVGEVWQPQASAVAYWQKDAFNRDGYNSNLPCIMDFPLMDAVKEAFAPDGVKKGRGLNKLFASLGQDYLYADPTNIMTFADNHDTERIATLIDNDRELYRMVFAFLLTTRGIPQLYYGSEIMMNSNEEGIYTSNANRKDMSGGWQEDSRDVFTEAGRTSEENEVYGYISKLLNWRKVTPAVQTGNLRHFKPQDGIYVYFRYTDESCVMVVLNVNDKPQELKTVRFAEILGNFRSGTNVMTGENLEDLSSVKADAKSAVIIELKK